MERPTRQEQAEAILARRGALLANDILGRRATNAADFAEAFNVERIDLLAAIPTPEALMALARNVSGPRDGLYVIDDGNDRFRVYVQERGVVVDGAADLSFAGARDLAIDHIIHLQGLPYEPPG